MVIELYIPFIMSQLPLSGVGHAYCVDYDSDYSTSDDKSGSLAGSKKDDHNLKKGLTSTIKLTRKATSHLLKPSKGCLSVKTYTGAALPAIASKAPWKPPTFQTACQKMDHMQEWDDSVSASRSCHDECPLMALFSMYSCGLGVVCRKCKCIIHPGELCDYLHRNHRQHAGISYKKDYEFVAHHIMTMHHFGSEKVFDW